MKVPLLESRIKSSVTANNCNRLLHSLLKLKKKFTCMSILSVCRSVCLTCTWCLRRPEKAVISSGPAGTGGCELHYMGTGTELESSEKEQFLLITGTFLPTLVKTPGQLNVDIRFYNHNIIIYSPQLVLDRLPGCEHDQ